MPAAIVQRAELVTLVSTAGVSQSAARYLLQTKLPFLAIRFPPGASLWSVSLNGNPVKPRRRGDQIVLSLQTDQVGNQDDMQQRDLQVVYEAPVSNVSWVGQIRTQAPQLWLIQDEQDTGVPVPQVDLVWYLHLPTGYRVSRVHGTVFTSASDLQPPKSPWQLLAQAGATVGGGMPGPFLPMAPMGRQLQQLATTSVENAPDAYSRYSVAEGERGSAPVTAGAAHSAGDGTTRIEGTLSKPRCGGDPVAMPSRHFRRHDRHPVLPRARCPNRSTAGEAKTDAGIPPGANMMPGMGSGGGPGGMGGMPGAGRHVRQ